MSAYRILLQGRNPGGMEGSWRRAGRNGRSGKIFNKILIATDLSKASDRVLACTQQPDSVGHETAILVHALGIQYLRHMRHGMAYFIEPYLKKQKELLEAERFQATCELALGPAVVEVNRIAKEQDASLIVVGSHGTTLAREMLLGGTATGIVSHARVPVLLIRLKIADAGGEARCEAMCGDFREQVLYCTDFSETAERAFPFVEKIVESGGKRVTLLHVQTGLASRSIWPSLGRISELTVNASNRCGPGWNSGAPRGPDRNPVRSAKSRDRPHRAEQNYHLIVLGTRGRGFFAEAFLGSVSLQVVRSAPAPVLLVPPVREQP